MHFQCSILFFCPVLAALVGTTIQTSEAPAQPDLSALDPELGAP